MNKLLQTILLATLAIIGLSSPGFAAEADVIILRDGTLLEGRGIITEQDYRGYRIVLPDGSAGRWIRPEAIARMERANEPNLYRRGLVMMHNASYESAIRQLMLARSDAESDSWVAEAATFQLGRCYLLRGRAESDIHSLMDARKHFLNLLTRNDRSLFRQQAQYALGQLYLTAAEETPIKGERLGHLLEARRRFTLLQSDATGGAFRYNANDPTRLWELRAAVGILTCDARRITTTVPDFLLKRITTLQGLATAGNHPDMGAELAWILYDTRLNATDAPVSTKAALEGIAALDHAVRALVEPDGTVDPSRERLLCRIHLLTARLYETLALLQKNEANTYRKKALLSHLRVVILYADSSAARAEVSQAYLKAAAEFLALDGITEENAKRYARNLLKELQTDFAVSKAWRSGGQQMYERIRLTPGETSE